MCSLTHELVLAKTKVRELNEIRKLNCWASNLSDISLLKRMPNIEILTLSVNNITSLEEIQHCRSLCELYIRNNNIANLNEIFYLKELKHLKILWLADNPCAAADNYRYTVLKTLPNLQKLDNASVSKEELDEAFKFGKEIEKPSHNSNMKSCEKLKTSQNGTTTDEETSSDKNLTDLVDNINLKLLNDIRGGLDDDDDEENGDNNGPTRTNNNNNKDRCFLEAIDESTDSNLLTRLNEPLLKEYSMGKINQLRQELGFKSLDSHNGNNNDNILNAMFMLIQELNVDALDKVIHACQCRKHVLAGNNTNLEFN